MLLSYTQYFHLQMLSLLL